MMKWLYFILLGCNLLISSCSVSKKKSISEGIMLHRTIVAEDGFKNKGERFADDGFQKEERYLLKDDFLIFEQKLLNNNGYEGSTTKSVTICNYVFIDLPKRICYVYGNLSDTAQPIFRYQLTESTPGWGWIIRPNGNFDAFMFKQLPDTLVDGMPSKRVQLIKEESNVVSSHTYYGSLNFPQTIFKFHPHIDSLLKPAIPFRSDFKTNDVDLFSIGELKVIKNRLNQKELAIFKSWEKNANASTSKIYDMKEGMKFYGMCACQKD